MFQTSYTGLKPLHRNRHYLGGFCKFWYIPVQDVAVFPRINSTQYLAGEPVLKAGKKWFGPIDVPRDRLGYIETIARTKAGHYYKKKVEGTHIGDSPENRINQENMPYSRYIIMGKVRAGGFYMMVGTEESPCEYNPEYRSGNGPADTAATNLVFNLDHIAKAYVLPGEFSADKQAPSSGGSDGGGGGSSPMQKEVIPFESGAIVSIPWTATRLNKFGNFPLVEVWLKEPNELPYLSHGGIIEIDALPPAFTEMTVKPGADLPGFVVLG